jgi:hypothetical protein
VDAPAQAAGDPSTTGGRITTGIFLAMIDRGTTGNAPM